MPALLDNDEAAFDCFVNSAVASFAVPGGGSVEQHLKNGRAKPQWASNLRQYAYEAHALPNEL